MPRRPCQVTQSVIERAIKAARHTGAHSVRIQTGTDCWIEIMLGADHGENPQLAKERAAERDAVL